VVTATLATSLRAGQFEDLGVPVKKAGLMGFVVGPDISGQRDLVYLNFMQNAGRLFLLAVDPQTGEATQYFSPQDSGGWATVLGPDQRIYLGTFGQGLILCFDPARPNQGIQVVGRPAPTETYIWQLVVGPDRRLYGCTYPSAKLVAYDPASGVMEDLGRMSATEMYARNLAAGADGKLYTSIGFVKPDLVMYDPATKEHRSILPADWQEVTGTQVVAGSNGKVYAQISHHDSESHSPVSRLYRVDNGHLLPEDHPEYVVQRLRDGRVVSDVVVGAETGQLIVRDETTQESATVPFRYQGEGIGIFVVGVGPEGCVYGSTAMPLEVFRYDPRKGASEHLGNMPGGEVYSMLEDRGKLYLCYYGGSVMNLYDPQNPLWKWGATPDCNPRSFGALGDGHLRPRAMIRGPEDLIYIGSHPPYGQLGGAMAVWDPQQNQVVENYRHLVKNQSIVALAYEPRSGLIFGGSGNYGGGGTEPAEKEAMFFAFDPRKKEKVLEVPLVPGAQTYAAMCAAGGRVFAAVGATLYVFDTRTMSVAKQVAIPGSQVEISLGLHSDGLLYGLCSQGVYTVDPQTCDVQLIARAPVPVSCGFALTTTGLYFGSGAHLWRYMER
jgi:streptogramin lyase